MYCVGNTLDDDRDVYGRRALFTELNNGPHRRLLLVGMRRTGKTATLLQIERRALADGSFVPLYIAPEGCRDVASLRDSFANALSRRRKLLPALPGGFLKLRELPLGDLLLVAGESAEQAGVPLFLLIDEADALATVAEQDPSVVNILRASWPSMDGARVLLTGSRQAVRLLHEPFGQPEPMLAGFAQRTLSPVLARGEALDLVALRQRGGEGRVDFTQAQTSWLLDRTGGHPYLTQATCDQARRLKTGPELALGAVMAAFPASNAFQQDLERTSPSERAVLQAVIDGQGLEDWHEPYVRSLLDVGLLSAERALSVPVLADFVARIGWENLPSRLQDADVAPVASARPAAPPTTTRYRTLRVLGEGAFGEVLLVESISPQGVRRLVAVKLLRKGWESQAAVAARLRDEARILALLRHRAILRAEDIVRLDDRLGVLMEYVPGVDIRDLIEQNRRGVLPLCPPRVVAEIAAEVAEALDVAYNRVAEGEPGPFRVLHRDIKPHNIRLTEDGEVKVLDFGVAGAQFAGREHVTQRGGGGTITYMAPERHLGEHNLPASDIFSLGVVMAELSSGLRLESPWPTSPVSFERLIDPMLDYMEVQGAEVLVELVRAMLSFRPEDRPQAAEVAAASRRLAAGLPAPDLRAWARLLVPRARRDPNLSSMDLSVGSHEETVNDDFIELMTVSGLTEKDD